MNKQQISLIINGIYGYRGAKVQVLNVYTKEGVKLVEIKDLTDNSVNTLLYSVFTKRCVKL